MSLVRAQLAGSALAVEAESVLAFLEGLANDVPQVAWSCRDRARQLRAVLTAAKQAACPLAIEQGSSS